MYWYAAGAVICLVFAWYFKPKTATSSLRLLTLIMASGFLLAALQEGMAKTEEKKYQLARNEPGQGSQEREFLVNGWEEIKDYPFTVEIAEKKLTKKQRKQCLDQAKKELDQVIIGENISLDQVTKPLFLPEYLQDGAVEVSYSFSDYEVFRPDGSLEQEPKEPVLAEITAELSCQEESCLYQFYVRAVPREKSAQELFEEKLKALIEKENQRESATFVELPEELDGKTLTWKEDKKKTGVVIVFMATALGVGMILREKENQKRKEAERKKQMLFDYAGIVGKLSLLLGAGMNISHAWEKIALSYRRQRESGEIGCRFAYEEMLGTFYEMQDGIGELQAYENFGKRCQLGAYRKLSSMLVQNVRKGAKGMQKLLEEEEWEAYEQRKTWAKRAGEEAGTKLLLPMGIMLVIVLAILMIPAGMSLNL